MVEIRAIDLKGHIPGGASIEFLRAEIPSKYRTPFAVIRYSLQGVEQEYGLRLDLDKRVFLDHFEDKEREETIQRAAPKIVEFLRSVLYPFQKEQREEVEYYEEPLRRRRETIEPSWREAQKGFPAKPFLVGESLVGEGNEVAHIDLMIGPKNGPVGAAFANRLAMQTQGHSALLALLAPNLPAKPYTVIFNKVTIKGAKQAVQMFGPAQASVAKAVADSVAEGVIPKNAVEDLCIVCGVFIHWEAEDNKKTLIPGCV